MSDNDMIKVRKIPDGTVVQILEDGTTQPLEHRSDWARVNAFSEEEIEANALSDPDNPPLTAAQLERMQPVPNPRAIRQRLQLTQEQFSLQFHLPINTLRDWEQGRKEPDSAARTLLRVIEVEPEAVLRALSH